MKKATMRCFCLVFALTLSAGCAKANDTNAKQSPSSNPRAISAAVHYKPVIDPAKFTDKVTNKYFPLTPGTTMEYIGTKDGVAETQTMTIGGTKMIMGVTTIVVHDVVTAAGSVVEDTYDWYAQNTDTGDVWYFGEDTKELDQGKVVSTHGTWLGGKDGAQPGIIMKADPTLNTTYRQEYYAGQAEDQATPLRLDGSITVPYGSFKDALVTVDFTPLEPDKIENKYYAPGVGFVYGQGLKNALEIKLSKVTHA